MNKLWLFCSCTPVGMVLLAFGTNIFAESLHGGHLSKSINIYSHIVFIHVRTVYSILSAALQVSQKVIFI